MTEPQAGSDASVLQCRAILENGHWILNDTKVFINTTSRSDIAVIMAVPDPAEKQALLVEKDTPDLEVANKENMPGVQRARQRRFI